MATRPPAGQLTDLVEPSKESFERGVDGEPSAEELATTINLVGAGISHVSLSQRVLWANPFYCDLVGYSLDELRTLHLHDTTCADDLPLQEEMIRRLRTGEERVVTFEKRFVRKDRRVVWGRLTVSLVRDALGRPRHFAAITADIDELKQAESSLIHNRRQLEDAESVACAGSWERDLATGTLHWSAGGYRLFGLDRWTTDLDFPLFLSMVHEEDRRRLVETLEGALREKSDFEIEYRIHRRDGETRILHVRGRLFRDGAGRPLRSLGTMQDVTDVRRQEQTIREQQRALSHSEALAAIGSLAASVGHEINNPLAFVLLNLESVAATLPDTDAQLQRVLATSSGGPVPDDAHRLLDGLQAARTRIEEAVDGVRRIGAMVRTLKGLSGADSDDNQPIDPIRPINTALSMAWNGIQHRARIVKDFSPVPHVIGDDVRLAQVFLNLLVNAAGAIEEGRAADHEIRVVVRHDGGEVTVEVRDTGCGIPDENLARIFEPFFSTKSRTVGTGLGLPISRKIIQDMGGRIDVRSQVGKGTSFTVRLRAARSAPPEVCADPRVPQVDAEVPELRVLVADDEPVIRRAVGRALRRCTIIEAESGEEARRILVEDRNFDLILCDMMMPRMSGVELHEWLVQLDPALARRMVFITGGAFTAPARAFLQRPEVKHLEKPFSSATLRRMVAEVAGGRPR